MQNSTQWSNLFLNELKYNINVYHDSAKFFIAVSSTLLLTSILLVCYYFEQNPTLTQSAFIMFALFLCLFTGAITYKRLEYKKQQSGLPLISFELTIEGDVNFSVNEKYSIHTNSRTGIWGCWLELIPNDGLKHNKKSIFIFKNSVSAKSYARICRAITRNSFILKNEQNH